MSRVGRAPIPVPSGVEVTLEGRLVRVKGPRGTLERTVHADIKVERQDDHLLVKRPSDDGFHRSLHGLTRALIANMVQGVTEGFEKNLEIHGVGYRAVPKGDSVEFSLGFSHPIPFDPPNGIEIEIPAPNRVVVRGVDKELVGQVAAEIRGMRVPDPYKQKGVRYAGEYIRKKAGKTAK